MTSPKAFGVGTVIGVLLTLISFFIYQQYQAPAVLGADATAISGKPTEPVAVSGGQIRAYQSSAKRALHLPADVVADQGKHVVAATTAPANNHPQTVTAVTDAQSGVTQLYVRQEPLPWFSRRRAGKISLSRGFQGSEQVTQIEVSEDFAQVKMIRFGVTAQGQTNGKAFVGLRASMEW